jgi:hypothetical protein
MTPLPFLDETRQDAEKVAAQSPTLKFEHIPGDTRPEFTLATMAPISDEYRDQLTAFVAQFKASRPQVEQPKLREFVGPFPIRFAQPERKPQPYLLVKKQGGAA